MTEIEIEQFLSTQLKHHIVTPDRLAGKPEVADWVKEAYATLMDMTQESEHRASMARLDRVRAAFEKASAVFGVAVAMGETELAKRTAEVSQLSQDLSAARTDAAEREQQQQVATSLAAELAAARAAVRDREIAVAEGERRIAEIGEQLVAIKTASEELSRERNQLAAALEEEKAVAARNDAQAALLGQELETTRSTVRQHETSAIQLRANLDKAQTILNDRKVELDKISHELNSAQSAIRDRDRENDRLSHDLEATRRFLRESQSEIQRLAGELDGARIKAERVTAERQRVADAFAAKSSELDLARGQMGRLQEEREQLHFTAAQLPIARGEVVALESALKGSRREADRRERQINELFAELQSAAAQLQAREQALERVAREKDEAVAAEAVHFRDLETRLEVTREEKDRLAAELVQMAAEIRRAEKSAAALEAVRAAALAATENKAQAQIRSLRDQLVDAEAALAKVRNEKQNGPIWMTLFSSSKRHAERQLRDSGLFDAEWYMREYPDVAESGLSPAKHYLEEGYLRGYRPNPLFDTRWYLEHYEDVRRAGVNPLIHYLQNGYREGRDPGPEFETDFYLLTYPDVRMNGINPLTHYLQYGKAEGRLPMKPRGG